MQRYTMFVSMPFGDDPDSEANEWSRLYTYGIKPCKELAATIENQVPPIDGATNVELDITRADHKLTTLGLKENVKAHIEQSDFMLCVLTVREKNETLLNPNLLWEIGHAEAKDKVIVFLSNSQMTRDIPALVGADNLFCIYDPVVFKPDQKIGDVQELGRSVAQRLLPYLTAAISDTEQRRPARRKTKYDVTAYANREVVAIPALIETAKTNIDILATNLDYFLRELGEPHPDEGKQSRLEDALNRKVAIRLVVLDPDCHIAEYRARQLGMSGDVGEFREEMRNAIVEFYARLKKWYGEGIWIKIYEDLPLQTTIRIDSNIITNFLTRGQRGRKRVHVRFDVTDEGVYDTFVGHISSVYDSAKDVREYTWLYRELERRAGRSYGAAEA